LNVFRVGQYRYSSEFLKRLGFVEFDDRFEYSPGANEIIFKQRLAELTAYVQTLKISEVVPNGSRPKLPLNQDKIPNSQRVSKMSEENQSKIVMKNDLSKPSVAKEEALVSVNADLLKSKLKQASMERVLHSQRSLIRSLNANLQSTQHDRDYQSQLLFERKFLLEQTNTKSNKDVHPLNSEKLEPYGEATILITESSPAGLFSLPLSAISPIKSGNLLLMGKGATMEAVRVCKRDKLKFDCPTQYCHSQGERVLIFKHTKSSCLHIRKSIIDAFVRDLIINCVETIFQNSTIKQDSHSFPVTKSAFRLSKYPALDGFHHSRVIAFHSSDLFVICRLMALFYSCLDLSTAADNSLLKVRGSNLKYLFTYDAVVAKLSSKAFFQHIWKTVLSSTCDFISWEDYLNNLPGSDFVAAEKFFSQTKKLGLRLIFDIFSKLSMMKDFTDVQNCFSVLDGIPCDVSSLNLSHSLLDKTQFTEVREEYVKSKSNLIEIGRCVADLVSEYTKALSLMNIRRWDTFTQENIKRESSTFLLQSRKLTHETSSNQDQVWHSEFISSMNIILVLDTTGIITVFDYLMEKKCSGRVYWSENPMNGHVETQKDFMHWYLNADHNEIINSSKFLAEKTKALSQYMKSRSIFIDETGVIGVDSILGHSSICFYDPISLRRLLRIKWPFILSTDLLAAATACRRKSKFDIPDKIGNVDGLIKEWQFSFRKKQLVCSVYSAPNIYFVDLSTGLISSTVNTEYIPNLFLYISSQNTIVISDNNRCARIISNVSDIASIAQSEASQDLPRVMQQLRDAFLCQRTWKLCRIISFIDKTSKQFDKYIHGNTIMCEVVVDNIFYRKYHCNLLMAHENARRQLEFPKWSADPPKLFVGGLYSIFDYDDTYIWCQLDKLSPSGHSQESLRRSLHSLGVNYSDVAIERSILSHINRSCLFTVGNINHLEFNASLNCISISDTIGNVYVSNVDFRLGLAFATTRLISTATNLNNYCFPLPIMVNNQKSFPSLWKKALQLDMQILSETVKWKGYVYELIDGGLLTLKARCFSPSLICLSPSDPPNISFIEKSELSLYSDLLYRVRHLIIRSAYIVSNENSSPSKVYQMIFSTDLTVKPFSAVHFSYIPTVYRSTFRHQSIIKKAILLDGDARKVGGFFDLVVHGDSISISKLNTCKMINIRCPSNYSKFSTQFQTGLIRKGKKPVTSCCRIEFSSLHSTQTLWREIHDISAADKVKCFCLRIDQLEFVRSSSAGILNLLFIDEVPQNEMFVDLLAANRNIVNTSFFTTNFSMETNADERVNKLVDMYSVSGGRLGGYLDKLLLDGKSSLVDSAVNKFENALTKRKSILSWFILLKKCTANAFATLSCLSIKSILLWENAWKYYFSGDYSEKNRIDTGNSSLLDHSLKVFSINTRKKYVDLYPDLSFWVYDVSETVLETYTSCTFLVAKSNDLNWKSINSSRLSKLFEAARAVPVHLRKCFFLPIENVQFIGENMEEIVLIYDWQHDCCGLHSLLLTNQRISIWQAFSLITKVYESLVILRNLEYCANFINVDNIYLTETEVKLILLPNITRSGEVLSSNDFQSYLNFLSSTINGLNSGFDDVNGMRILATALLTKTEDSFFWGKVTDLLPNSFAACHDHFLLDIPEVNIDRFCRFEKNLQLRKNREKFCEIHHHFGVEKKQMLFYWDTIICSIAANFLELESIECNMKKLLEENHLPLEIEDAFYLAFKIKNNENHFDLQLIQKKVAILEYFGFRNLLSFIYSGYPFSTKFSFHSVKINFQDSLQFNPVHNAMSDFRKSLFYSAIDFNHWMESATLTFRKCDEIFENLDDIQPRKLDWNVLKNVETIYNNLSAATLLLHRNLSGGSNSRKLSQFESIKMFILQFSNLSLRFIEKIKIYLTKLSLDNSSSLTSFNEYSSHAEIWLQRFVALIVGGSITLALGCHSSWKKSGNSRKAVVLNSTRERLKPIRCIFRNGGLLSSDLFKNSSLDKIIHFIGSEEKKFCFNPCKISLSKLDCNYDWLYDRSFPYYLCIGKLLKTLCSEFLYIEDANLHSSSKNLLNLLLAFIPLETFHHMYSSLSQLPISLEDVFQAFLDLNIFNILCNLFHVKSEEVLFMIVEFHFRLISLLTCIDDQLLTREPVVSVAKHLGSFMWVSNLVELTRIVKVSIEIRKKCFSCLQLMCTKELFAKHFRRIGVFPKLAKISISESIDIANSFSRYNDKNHMIVSRLVRKSKKDTSMSFQSFEDRILDIQTIPTISETFNLFSDLSFQLQHYNFELNTCKSTKILQNSLSLLRLSFGFVPKILTAWITSKDTNLMISDLLALLIQVLRRIHQFSVVERVNHLQEFFSGDLLRSLEIINSIPFTNFDEVRMVMQIISFCQLIADWNVDKLSYGSPVLFIFCELYLKALFWLARLKQVRQSDGAAFISILSGLGDLLHWLICLNPSSQEMAHENGLIESSLQFIHTKCKFTKVEVLSIVGTFPFYSMLIHAVDKAIVMKALDANDYIPSILPKLFTTFLDMKDNLPADFLCKLKFSRICVETSRRKGKEPIIAMIQTVTQDSEEILSLLTNFSSSETEQKFFFEWILIFEKSLNSISKFLRSHKKMTEASEKINIYVPPKTISKENQYPTFDDSTSRKFSLKSKKAGKLKGD
jgi:hypothetical protein